MLVMTILTKDFVTNRKKNQNRKKKIIV